ncbi:MAG: response regulator [Armatimonadetes bacterium]|nr:response regulator [Armatimonadota bacterium]NDK10883.1 response regulator [Armatimonadota bacterium]
MAKIVVLDDDTNTCNLIRVALEQDRHKVTTTQHAKEAWRAISLGADLLLLDLNLPETNGWEFAKRVRLDPGLAELPIVVITARSGFFDKTVARGYDVAEFIRKPFTPAAIRELVSKALASRASPGPR